MGTVSHPYQPHDPQWEGHWMLSPDLTWEALPTFE